MVSLITGSIGLLVAALIVMLMRRDRLHARHGLAWILVAVGFALLGFAPLIIDKIAGYLGVSYPPILAITLAISLLVLKILILDIERSHLEMRIERLIQRLAILETELEHTRLKSDEPGVQSRRDRSAK